MQSGDTAWMLVCTALVLFMTPGLAFFYGGMVRAKNVLAMLAQNFTVIAVVSILWVLFVYSLAFGPDLGGGLIGTLHFAGFAHANEPIPGMHLTVPPVLYATFEMMFAVLTIALLTGAVADRMTFGGFLAFSAVWVTVVYAPIAHWVWSPHGWLAQRHLLDFAGGTVVEISAGASALALLIVLKPRLGWPREAMPPHSLPFTLLGAGILWFGWFGFNAGSALAAGNLAAQALLNTHLGACAGLLAWLLVEKLRTGHATTLGAASGAVAGLVALTPSCGYVNSIGAILIGFAAGSLGVLAIQMKFRWRIDDALDVVGVHGVCGLIGTVAIGLLASHAINPAGRGLIDGSGGLTQLGRQLIGAGAAAAWAFGVTYVIARVLNRTMRLRVDEADEVLGLDRAIHAENAYEHLTSGRHR
jgi:Amt family ammonium transporter